MPQYLLAVHMVEGQPTPSEEEMKSAYAAVDTFNAKLQAQGMWVFGGGLHPADTATVVDATGGDILTTDGPFAEAKEQLGGFILLDLPSLDAALEWAARCPAAVNGGVEVRPKDAAIKETIVEP